MKKTNKPHPLKVFNDNKAMAYKKAGGEMAAYKKSLNKFSNGGPGSGMGRMAADDAAFDAMMNPPNKPASSSLSPETARLLAAKASKGQNTLMNTNDTNSQNVDLTNAMLSRMKNTAPLMSKPPGVREGFTPEQMHRFNATPIKNKKGGAVKRKKK